MQRLLKDIIDFLQISVIGVVPVWAQNALAVNNQGESVVLKNVLVLLGIVAMGLKIWLMIRGAYKQDSQD